MQWPVIHAIIIFAVSAALSRRSFENNPLGWPVSSVG